MARVVALVTGPGAEVAVPAHQLYGSIPVCTSPSAGFSHIVLSWPAPYPDGVARWVADELLASFV